MYIPLLHSIAGLGTVYTSRIHFNMFSNAINIPCVPTARLPLAGTESALLSHCSATGLG
jgi:hypothetical protein